jgi:hypothetical protein
MELRSLEQKATKATKQARQAATIGEQRDGDNSPDLRCFVAVPRGETRLLIHPFSRLYGPSRGVV